MAIRVVFICYLTLKCIEWHLWSSICHTIWRPATDISASAVSAISVMSWRASEWQKYLWQQLTRPNGPLKKANDGHKTLCGVRCMPCALWLCSPFFGSVVDYGWDVSQAMIVLAIVYIWHIWRNRSTFQTDYNLDSYVCRQKNVLTLNRVNRFQVLTAYNWWVSVTGVWLPFNPLILLFNKLNQHINT